MTKNIRDYLHLYLGCECWWEDKYGDSGGRTEIDFYMIAELYGERIKLKLILRPLSNMTEEEMKESEPFMFDSFELTRYLLSKHFDLFGLIDAGLAIDKTTINSR
jgi:hypothetical protein